MEYPNSHPQLFREVPVPESQYQAKLIKRLEARFPGCMVLKNDSGYKQGIPDLTILWGPCWASLEVKMGLESPRQPNQEWYVEHLDDMSFAAFICPENEAEVLDALQEAFASRGATCVPQS